MAQLHKYVLLFGEEEPTVFPDNLNMAMEWLLETIKDLKERGYLPAWRALGLYEQARNMPRAGFTFTVDSIGLIGTRRERFNA